MLGRIRRKCREERGQVLVLFAAGLAAMLGMVGLAVDVGQIVATRTDLQKVADAAVFAAAQDLPTKSSAEASANAYVLKNGGTNTDSTVTVSSTYGQNDTVTVEARRQVNYTFLRVLGLSGTQVKASAKARIANYVGGAGLLPWGFIASNDPVTNKGLLQNPCYTGLVNGLPTFKQNTLCTVKEGAGTQAGGDFGILALDQNGADQYAENIVNGSTGAYKIGDELEPQTGDIVGKTKQGIDGRFSLPAPTGCPGNDRDDVLTTNADGTVSIIPGCEDSPRIGVIPVVDQIVNVQGQKSTILGFAFVFLHGTTGNGGQLKVQLEFVKYVTELPKGIYTSTTPTGASAVKLVE